MRCNIWENHIRWKPKIWQGFSKQFPISELGDVQLDNKRPIHLFIYTFNLFFSKLKIGQRVLTGGDEDERRQKWVVVFYMGVGVGSNTPDGLWKISLAKEFPKNCCSKRFAAFLCKTLMTKSVFRKVADEKCASLLKIQSITQ